jgi:hypothetical protein
MMAKVAVARTGTLTALVEDLPARVYRCDDGSDCGQ